MSVNHDVNLSTTNGEQTIASVGRQWLGWYKALGRREPCTDTKS